MEGGSEINNKKEERKKEGILDPPAITLTVGKKTQT